jgi:hypothetical protein
MSRRRAQDIQECGQQWQSLVVLLSSVAREQSVASERSCVSVYYSRRRDVVVVRLDNAVHGCVAIGIVQLEHTWCQPVRVKQQQLDVIDNGCNQSQMRRSWRHTLMSMSPFARWQSNDDEPKLVTSMA